MKNKKIMKTFEKAMNKLNIEKKLKEKLDYDNIYGDAFLTYSHD